MDFTIINSASKYLQPISNQLIWRIDTEKKEVFLTFDDGPHPEVTPWIIQLLQQFNAKATFFLVGENAMRYPEVVQQLIAQGHHLGNHTFNHLKGWNEKNFTYYKNTLACENEFTSSLFRPPHGRITRDQHRALNQRYKIIMWSLLARDYNPSVSPNYIIKTVSENTTNGEIIVFHDSDKAAANLKNSLPQILKNLSDQGFQFSAIPYTVQYSEASRGAGNL